MLDQTEALFTPLAFLFFFFLRRSKIFDHCTLKSISCCLGWASAENSFWISSSPISYPKLAIDGAVVNLIVALLAFILLTQFRVSIVNATPL